MSSSGARVFLRRVGSICANAVYWEARTTVLRFFTMKVFGSVWLPGMELAVFVAAAGGEALEAFRFIELRHLEPQELAT